MVIEDLISTGKSSLRVVEVLKNAGLDVVGMVAIFTYGFPVAEDAFKAAGVPFKTLTNYETLIQLAVEKEVVSPQQQGILLNWQKDPANWKGL